MSKKRICLLAVGLTLLLAAGFFLALPRTLFDEPFSATVWSRDGRLLSAKVAPDGQWRFFPTDSVPGKFRTAITTYEDKRFDRHFGVDPLALARAVGQNLAAGRETAPSRSSIRSRGACWWPRSRSKAGSRALSSRPCTATATPCCSGISTTGISARPRWSTNFRSGPLPGVTA